MSSQDAEVGAGGEGADDLAATLAVVAGALPGGGEDRPGQLQMAQAVGRAIHERRHVVVQAGTGTGKSLAYLLPAVRAGRRVVVATATKALQDQLATKDLPFLAGVLGPEARFSFAVLKGRANYLCRERAGEVAGVTLGSAGGSGSAPLTRLFTMEGEPASRGDADAAIDELSEEPGADEPAADTDTAADADGGGAASEVGGFGAQVRRLIEWAAHSPTGDRGDLDFEPHPRAWATVSVTARECPGAFRCPSGQDCFAEAARARAAEADVVVVNTHLYATHVASDGAVLPDHDVVVFDEAHEVEEVMTDGLGIDLTAGRFRALAQAVRALVGRDDAGVVDAVAEVADRLGELLRAAEGRRVLATAQAPVEENRPDAPAERADAELASLLALGRGRLETLTEVVRRVEAGGTDDLSSRRARALQAASHLADDLDALARMGDDEVAWVESSGGGGARNLSLRLAPIEVGAQLAARLWPNVTAVLTSATVPPMVEARLGLPAQDTDHLDVGSPFPYRTNALLYVPSSLPDRRAPGAEAAIHEELARLIRAAGGRTLALFTSWRAMQGAHEALQPVLEFPLLAQNDLPKARLVAAFAEDEHACLFATMSFWQGIDVPGRTLSVVCIDRIPFPRPDDPLLQARRDRAGEAAFRVVDLPRAATLLAQGAGRLIRSASDTGVVAVLDRRLATAGYRRTLLDALPPMRRTTDGDEVAGFLARVTGGGGPPSLTA
ncbi:MAG TPA: ATP-dependent DNA helicase [Acidimicrobiales bacterium]|nr:ATP-dependent DNA helicase [Acidimicrobiales bacterium]